MADEVRCEWFKGVPVMSPATDVACHIKKAVAVASGAPCIWSDVCALSSEACLDADGVEPCFQSDYICFI